MKRSEQCDQLYAALALARANFGTAERTKEAKIKGKSKMSGESFEYKYKYAPLEECFKAIDQALSDQGLALVGGVEYSADGQMWVITHLGHTSGQWIENALNCGIPQDDKDMGGKITYARRYGVTLTVQMQAEDDDDGPRGEDSYQDRRQSRKPTPKMSRAPETPANGVGVSDGKSPGLATVPAVTVQEVMSLAELAEAAGLDHSKFGDDMRLLLELEPSDKLTRAFLAQHLTREQYDDRWQRYTELVQELADDVPVYAEPNAPESSELHEPSMGDDIPAGGHEDVATGLVDGLQSNIGNSEVVDPLPSGEGDSIQFEAEKGTFDNPIVPDDEKRYATVNQLDTLAELAQTVGEKAIDEVHRLRTRHRNVPLPVYQAARDALLLQQAQQKKTAKV